MKITKGFILPSAAFPVPRSQIRTYKKLDAPPKVGDLVYGTVSLIGQHSTLQNTAGRLHRLHDGTKAVFVFGNRYAPDFFEALVPDTAVSEIDMVSQSGIISDVRTKNYNIKDPTRIKLLGYVCDSEGNTLNTRDFSVIKPKRSVKKFPRSKMILLCGTSMNSGKSMAAAACCWALSSMGHNVRASKITGTASLGDILHMNDAGASSYADFTYMGHPSTYMLEEHDVIDIFNKFDLKYANNPKNFWVVELSDGIMQRETAILLKSSDVKKRIHKFVFCAADAFGAIGGLKVLKEEFDIVPDAISGICSSSPLHIRELESCTDIPVFESAKPDIKQLAKVLL